MHGIPLSKKMARDDRVTFYQGMAQETNVADRRHVSARGHVSALQRLLTNLGYLQLHMQHQKIKLMQLHGRKKMFHAGQRSTMQR
jgi:hypothetical protein